MKKYLIYTIAFALIMAANAVATVGQFATIEGIVLSFTQTTIVISQRGKLQKIPRVLVPESVDLKSGMYLTIEIPVSR